MPPRERPVHEKPYVLVEFAAGEPRRASVPGHQALQPPGLSGWIDLMLVPRTPVQVASGSFEVGKTRQGEEILIQGSSVERYTEAGTRRRRAVLPGASLKGALRSLVEAISPSCVVVNAGATRFAIPDKLRRCARVEKLCPACRLFGMSGSGQENYLGQVSVEDGVLEDGGLVIVRTPLLWAPARGQRGLPGRYLAGRQARGRKFYYHSQPASGPDARIAVRTGSRLRTRLHFENLTPGELGLLIAALGQHPGYPFFPKVGAAKPVGLGSVEVFIDGVAMHGPVARTGRLGGETVRYSGARLEEELRAWIEAATTKENLLLENALQDVQAILKAETLKRPPVDGVY